METNKKISPEEIKKIADLARIEITPEEELKYARELAEILEHFEELQRLEVAPEESFAHLQSEDGGLRDDNVASKDFLVSTGIKEQFPIKSGEYLQVKAVLENNKKETLSK